MDADAPAKKRGPYKRQLEIIATMGAARIPLARIADAVGWSEAFLKAWLLRIAAAQDDE